MNSIITDTERKRWVDAAKLLRVAQTKLYQSPASLSPVPEPQFEQLDLRVRALATEAASGVAAGELVVLTPIEREGSVRSEEQHARLRLSAMKLLAETSTTRLWVEPRDATQSDSILDPALWLSKWLRCPHCEQVVKVGVIR